MIQLRLFYKKRKRKQTRTDFPFVASNNSGADTCKQRDVDT